MDQCRETAVRSTDWPSCYWKSKLGRCGLWSFINHFRLCGETPQVWPRQPTRSTRQLGCERFRTTNLCKLSLIWFCSQNGRVWCALLKCERVICQAESSDVMDKMAPRTSNLVLNLYAWCAYLALVSDAENQFWLGFTKSSRKWDRIRQVAQGSKGRSFVMSKAMCCMFLLTNTFQQSKLWVNRISINFTLF